MRRATGQAGPTAALIGAATLLAIGIEGYHPYAEDGGIYLAGVKRLLDPALYPHDSAFAMEPARWSVFAPAVAQAVRLTHAPLEWVLLALHMASIWATLLAVWLLVGRCCALWQARAGAVALMACWLGLPVAGTALYVMDPYLTARSFATPAMLLALVGALDATAWDQAAQRRRRGWALWAAGLTVCALVHPLTGLYATVVSMLLASARVPDRRSWRWRMAAACAAVFAASTFAQHLAPAEDPAYVRAALTRSYWFLSEWRWYEVAGLVAPLAILSAMGWWVRPAPARGEDEGACARRALARMAVISGLLSCMIAAAFAREDAATHLVARMQPLRIFHVVYIVMVVMLGAWLGERVLKQLAWRWATALVVLGGVMFGAARAEYSRSDHLELPWTAAKNPWVQAFTWIRANTPQDALFAMDADYIHAPAEDAQSFRAIAERSALPDSSKDGGEASIAPDLADQWVRGVAAQTGLDSISDAQRAVRLKPLGVTWLVLDARAHTAFDCPYTNARVRVCRLP